MKKFIMGLVGALLSFSLLASAGPGGDTFPWGAELPFPWKAIQGTWLSEFDGVEAYVIFKVVRLESGSSRQLKISVVDSVTCKVIAFGAGYEDNRVVKGVLTGVNSVSAKVTVHAFRQSDVRPGATNYNPNSQVTIMSVLPMNATPERTAFELTKINADTKVGCP